MSKQLELAEQTLARIRGLLDESHHAGLVLHELMEYDEALPNARAGDATAKLSRSISDANRQDRHNRIRALRANAFVLLQSEIHALLGKVGISITDPLVEIINDANRKIDHILRNVEFTAEEPVAANARATLSTDIPIVASDTPAVELSRALEAYLDDVAPPTEELVDQLLRSVDPVLRDRPLDLSQI
jgi:hypothetical protein